jgi:hypothetical protein
MRHTFALLIALATQGCADVDWSRNIYEGQRNRQQMELPDNTRPRMNSPDYDQYTRERERLQAPAIAH